MKALLTTLGLTALLALPSEAKADHRRHRPNISIVISDTRPYYYGGCYVPPYAYDIRAHPRFRQGMEIYIPGNGPRIVAPTGHHGRIIFNNRPCDDDSYVVNQPYYGYGW